jgi:hypothetical protein
MVLANRFPPHEYNFLRIIIGTFEKNPRKIKNPLGIGVQILKGSRVPGFLDSSH